VARPQKLNQKNYAEDAKKRSRGDSKGNINIYTKSGRTNRIEKLLHTTLTKKSEIRRSEGENGCN